MREHRCDIHELLAPNCLTLETGMRHRIVIRNGRFRLLLDPLDVLHFDGSHPDYESARGGANANGQSTPALTATLRSDDDEFCQELYLQDRPTCLGSALEFEFTGIPPLKRYSLQLTLRNESPVELFSELPYRQFADTFEATMHPARS